MILKIERINGNTRNLHFWVGPWSARFYLHQADEDGIRDYHLFPNGRPFWSGWHRHQGKRFGSMKVIPMGMDRMSYIMLKGAKSFEERKARLSKAANVLAWEDYDRDPPLYWYPRPWHSGMES